MRKFLLMAAALLGSVAASAQDTTSVKEFPKDKLFSFMTTRPDTCMDMRDVIVMNPFTDGSPCSERLKDTYIIINTKATILDVLGTGLNFYIESFNDSWINEHDGLFPSCTLISFDYKKFGTSQVDEKDDSFNAAFASMVGMGYYNPGLSRLTWDSLLKKFEQTAPVLFRANLIY